MMLLYARPLMISSGATYVLRRACPDYWRYNAGWGDIFWRDFYTQRLQEYWVIDFNLYIFGFIKIIQDISIFIF